jgi:hypothetical protein
MVHVRCQSRVAGSETKQRFFPAFDFAAIVRNRLFLFGIGRFFQNRPSMNELQRQETKKKQPRYSKETPILLRAVER